MASIAVIKSVHSRKLRTDRNEHHVELEEVMPTGPSVFKEGLASRQIKSIGGMTFAERKIVLTQKQFYMSRPDSDKVLDHIPLHEILRIEDPEADQKGGKTLFNSVRTRSASSFDRLQSNGSFAPNDDDDEAKINPACVFVIHTIEDGYNSGKSTVLLCESKESKKEWVTQLQIAAKTALKIFEGIHEMTWLQRKQRVARKFYHSDKAQYCVGVVIMASYFTALLSSQLLPERGSSTARHLRLTEIVFTAMFTVELLFNIFGSWLRPFLAEGWNYVDSFVVFVSWAGVINEDLPAVNVLRLVRVLKMVRLFRKLTELRMLINALTSSIVPVLYSFLILLLISTVYAVVATDLFSAIDPINFGDFSLSLFSLFQVSTGDSWASVITRGLIYNEDSNYSGAFVSIFFVSYVLVVGVVLMNIVVAVLLDEFITTVAREKQEMKAAKEAALAKEMEALGTPDQVKGPLDPLLKGLLGFTSEQDLQNRIDLLYDKLDLDESGAIDLKELNNGLKKFDFGGQTLRISGEDFRIITNHGKLLDADGELSPANFKVMMLEQLRLYGYHKVAAAMQRCEEDVGTEQIFALKMIMSNVESLSSRLTALEPPGGSAKHLSKKQIISKVLNMPLSRAFHWWRDAAGVDRPLYGATEHQLLCRRIDKLEERVFWEIQDLKALILQNEGHANSPTQNRTSSLPPRSLPQSAPRVIAHTRSSINSLFPPETSAPLSPPTKAVTSWPGDSEWLERVERNRDLQIELGQAGLDHHQQQTQQEQEERAELHRLLEQQVQSQRLLEQQGAERKRRIEPEEQIASMTASNGDRAVADRTAESPPDASANVGPISGGASPLAVTASRKPPVTAIVSCGDQEISSSGQPPLAFGSWEGAKNHGQRQSLLSTASRLSELTSKYSRSFSEYKVGVLGSPTLKSNRSSGRNKNRSRSFASTDKTVDASLGLYRERTEKTQVERTDTASRPGSKNCSADGRDNLPRGDGAGTDATDPT